MQFALHPFKIVGKPLAGFPDKLWQSAARIICPPSGDKFHTCSLRSVFCQVHALTENSLNFICRLRRQTLRGFFDKLKVPARKSRYFAV